MKPTRRDVLWTGGGFVFAFPFARFQARAEDSIEIVMRGDADGSRVWFDPLGIRIAPGQTLTWVNRDKGNAHTSTAYCPEIDGRPRRIPAAAEPWDSGYLLPDARFSVTFTEPGVYDYYCVPHEHAGMVGRIVVGDAGEADWGSIAPDGGLEPLPEVALTNFPSVADILRDGLVRPPVR